MRPESKLAVILCAALFVVSFVGAVAFHEFTARRKRRRRPLD